NDFVVEVEPMTYGASMLDSVEVEALGAVPEVGSMDVIRHAVTLPNPGVGTRHGALRFDASVAVPADPPPVAGLCTDDACACASPCWARNRHSGSSALFGAFH